MTVYLERRLENPIVHNGVPKREVEPQPEPFLTWDILQEARVPQLWNIPREDVEVAKTAIVLDSFPNLNLQQKRRLLAFRLWYLDSSYGKIKKYIGEGKAPGWETLANSSTSEKSIPWDSFIESVWDTPNLQHRFDELQEIMAVMNNLTNNGSDIIRFMIIFKKFRELEDRGLEYDEILKQRKKTVNDRSRLRARTYKYLELRMAGKTDEEIAANLRQSTEAVKTIQDGLLSYGFVTPFRNPEKERVESSKKEDTETTVIKETH